MRRAVRYFTWAVVLVILAGGCGGDTSSGGGPRTAEERAKFARQMCDTNEGGYYHIDEGCFERYMGR